MERKMTLYTTFRLLHEAGACVPRYEYLARKLGGITGYGEDTPIPLLKILELNGPEDCAWVFVLSAPTVPDAQRELARKVDEIVYQTFVQILPYGHPSTWHTMRCECCRPFIPANIADIIRKAIEAVEREVEDA